MRARDEFRARTHHRGGILIANLAREHTFLAFSLPLNISLMLFGQSAHGYILQSAAICAMLAEV